IGAGATATGATAAGAEASDAVIHAGSASAAGAAAASGAACSAPSPDADDTLMEKPQRRHFMRTVLPATLSSPIWYLALQLSQMNFIEARPRRGGGTPRYYAALGRRTKPDCESPGAAETGERRGARQRSPTRCSLIDWRVGSSGATRRARSHVSM